MTLVLVLTITVMDPTLYPVQCWDHIRPMLNSIISELYSLVI